MSFREAMPPNHPPGALPLDPAGGLPFPDPLCPPTRPPVPPPPNPGCATGYVTAFKSWFACTFVTRCSINTQNNVLLYTSFQRRRERAAIYCSLAGVNKTETDNGNRDTVATNQSINLVVLQSGVMRVNKLSPLGSSLYYNITVSLLQCDRWASQLLQEILWPWTPIYDLDFRTRPRLTDWLIELWFYVPLDTK